MIRARIFHVLRLRRLATIADLKRRVVELEMELTALKANRALEHLPRKARRKVERLVRKKALRAVATSRREARA